jgi:DNA-directed RNA polymerase specialized sigma24 family protein
MAATEVKRGRGRPPKAPEKGKRQNYTFRLSDSARQLLVEAAEKSGRSVSEEIEERVERSFEVDALMNSMTNEAVWNVMESIKANKGKPIDLAFAIALAESIARSERETRGVNSQLLKTDLVPFITSLYRATPDPSHKPSQIDEQAPPSPEELQEYRRVTGRKMTPDLAREILELYANAGMTQQEIAFQLGINQGRVNEVIIHGKWLSDDPNAPEAVARNKALDRMARGEGTGPKRPRRTIHQA